MQPNVCLSMLKFYIGCDVILNLVFLVIIMALFVFMPVAVFILALAIEVSWDEVII